MHFCVETDNRSDNGGWPVLACVQSLVSDIVGDGSNRDNYIRSVVSCVSGPRFDILRTYK